MLFWGEKHVFGLNIKNFSIGLNSFYFLHMAFILALLVPCRYKGEHVLYTVIHVWLFEAENFIFCLKIENCNIGFNFLHLLTYGLSYWQYWFPIERGTCPLHSNQRRIIFGWKRLLLAQNWKTLTLALIPSIVDIWVS